MIAPLRSILVVDDDAAMSEMLVSLLEEKGFSSEAAGSGEAALERLRARDFDAILSDVKMPGMSGLELLAQVRELRPGTPVVLMTAFGSIDSAVAAMRDGAFHYVTKPFKREEVLVVLERAVAHRELEAENQRLRRAVDRTSSFGDLLGESPAMREIFALIRKVADSKSSVLITGESGTGKEVVSRTIHFTGLRAQKPFVPINCTAIPEGLLESELFGHVRGAFTGATSNKQGLFEKADGGTLFLDEIGDMGGSLQSKLLRVLQDGEVRPVGGTRSTKVDVRIIAATNKDLRIEIEAGRFRRDLFYRLNVIPIELPPLRERPEDVAVMAEAFVLRHAQGEPRTLTRAAIDRLKRCRFEGNARELENVIERTIALADGNEIGPDDLVLAEEGAARSHGSEADFLAHALDERMTLRDLCDRYTERVLEQTGGNKQQAARILGIDRRTLYRRAERDSRENARPERVEKSSAAEWDRPGTH